MPTIRNDVLKETAADWSVSHGRRFRANIIIWGMRKHYSTLEVRTILADANFENLARGEMRWEGDHLRIVLTRGGSRIFLRGGQKAIEYSRSNVRGCRAQRAVARGVWGHAPPEKF